MLKLKRSQLFIDRHVQGVLLGRVAVYWSACLLFLTLPLAIAFAIEEPQMTIVEIVGEIWQSNRTMLTAVILLLPIAILDVLKLSNRFVGPVYRIRSVLNRVADGEKTDAILFRDGDFWQDLSESCNMLIEKLDSAGDAGTARAATDVEGARSADTAEAE